MHARVFMRACMHARAKEGKGFLTKQKQVAGSKPLSLLCYDCSEPLIKESQIERSH